MELPAHLRRLRAPVPPPVLHLLRRGFRQYGTWTARHRPMPDFLIIGAKKAGTSSLLNWLMQHPGVIRPFPAIQRIKSPHYFDINYWRGPDWYRSHFPTERSRRHQVPDGHAVVGEASPYYMFHPAVSERVTRDLPHARVIVMLRDPVARAYSNYWDRRASGHESIATFEEAIEAEPQRLAAVDQRRLLTDPRYYSADHDNHSYLARGRYLEHLAPWLEQLPPEQLLIMRAESMFDDPAAMFATVQKFLGLSVQAAMPLRPYNQRKHPPLEAATRALLADYYRPHNAALYEAIGFEMGWEAKYPPPASMAS